MSIFSFIAVPLLITAVVLLIKSKHHPALIYPGISLLTAAVINIVISFFV